MRRTFRAPGHSPVFRRNIEPGVGSILGGVGRSAAENESSTRCGLSPRAELREPFSSESGRHALTLLGATPNSDAIAVLAMPRAASNKTLARVTSRCGAVRDFARLWRILR